DVIIRFITSQNPLPNTVADFWTMVWQNDVTCIVMLTDNFENGKMKCCLYWPDDVLLVENLYHIKLREKHVNDHVIISILQLTNQQTGESRLTFHLKFLAWHSLLTFANFDNCGGAPLLVHCETGIGRSGVFLTVYMCASYILMNKKFDIKEIADRLKEQRERMIQTSGQYRLCYYIIINLLMMMKKKMMMK
ncbi:hypothetical protein HELRODRAFT_82988, partial [Helobdella robusta]|uniref:Tyrosine-protein phosphatase domain-containing protein n=1 Tax=Helobdella robusta TaxID=6412 RepID=T1G4Z0_HELRO